MSLVCGLWRAWMARRPARILAPSASPGLRRSVEGVKYCAMHLEDAREDLIGYSPG
jgi:hypothetical protein